MADTCSFEIGTNTRRNQNCFAYLRDVSDSHQLILIEKNKWIFSERTIEEYLDDLIEMGFNFTYEKVKDEYQIDVSKLKGIDLRTTFFMAVRFLWEGEYRAEHSYGSDFFTDVIRHYLVLKRKFPNESKLVVLCLACNCFLKSNLSFNANHFFSYSSSCHLFEKVSDIKFNSGVNGTFTNSKITLTTMIKGSKFPAWTEKHYDNLFRELGYEYTN